MRERRTAAAEPPVATARAAGSTGAATPVSGLLLSSLSPDEAPETRILSSVTLKLDDAKTSGDFQLSSVEAFYMLAEEASFEEGELVMVKDLQ